MINTLKIVEELHHTHQYLMWHIFSRQDACPLQSDKNIKQIKMYFSGGAGWHLKHLSIICYLSHNILKFNSTVCRLSFSAIKYIIIIIVCWCINNNADSSIYFRVMGTSVNLKNRYAGEQMKTETPLKNKKKNQKSLSLSLASSVVIAIRY